MDIPREKDEPDPRSRHDTIRAEDGALPSSKKTEIVKSDHEPHAEAAPPIEEDTSPLIGKTIDNYRIDSILGQGGFGIVFKALDVKLDRAAALKFLRVAFDPHHQKLFAREAKVLANLSKHPSIVQIYSWGEYGDTHYFAQEYLDGSAEQLLEGTPDGAQLKDVLSVAIPCADALAFAHDNGVLHRDIKPANILIDKSTGSAKLCDFGLARFHNLGLDSASGAISGSPAYMSPEQAAGERVDERSDIFSLGVTIFQLLCGRLPTSGTGMQEILDNVRSGRRVSLKTYRPDLPAEIIAMVDRATAHKPAKRYQKAEEFKADLDSALKDLLDSGQVGGAKQGSSRRYSARPNGFPKAAAAAVIAAVIGVVAIVGLMGIPGGGDPDSLVTKLQPSLSEAKTLLDSGEYEGAVRKSREALQANPADADSKYILGYGLLFSGELEEAEETFTAIEDPTRRQEGLAALAHARYDKNPAGLKAILDATESRSGYMSVLKATHEFLDEDFEQAALTLAPVMDMPLFFDWQREKQLQLLGRAYLALGNLDAASTAFQELQSLQRKSSAGMAQAYIQIVTNKMNESRRESVRKQLDRIVEARKEIDDEEDRDLWSSRPMRVWIMPSVTRRSRLAVESGLADIMPFLLAGSLTKPQQPPIEVVERDILLDILMEQDLSAKLSDGPDAIALGKVLAARLALVCNFNVLMGEEYLAVKLSDTATTRAITLDRFDLKRGVNPDEWVDTVAHAILDAIAEDYPIRGMVTASESETYLNVGAAVGVEAGMRFKLMRAAGSGMYPNSFAVAEGEPEASRTRVSLEGLDANEIPEAGLFVQAILSEPSEPESDAS